MEKEMRKKKIGVLLGGLSAEREVSLRSGKAVFKALKSIGYHVVAIDAKGDFYAKLKKQKIEQVFIALHGGHGENGAVQGMLEIMGIPYTGSGVLASCPCHGQGCFKEDLSLSPDTGSGVFNHRAISSQLSAISKESFTWQTKDASGR